MMKKSEFIIISSVIGIILFFAFLIRIIPKIPTESMCTAKKEALRLSIHGGILIKKYRDAPNHNYKTIRYRINNEETESLVFVLEESGCYDYLLEGDTLFKKENEVLFEVKRNGKDTVFILEHGCQ
jgi:hypothetical protein